MFFEQAILEVGDFIADELRKELAGQGHEATGKLMDSIGIKVTPSAGGVKLFVGSDLEYATFVNSGRKAGGKRVPIAALIEWIKQKAIASGNKKIKSIAYAIQEKIFQEGTPTKASLLKSPNGRRTGFVDIVAETKTQQIFSILSGGVFREVEKQVDIFVQQSNKKLN